MMKELKKAIEAVEALHLEESEEICSMLIKKAIEEKVTFLDWRTMEIINRIPAIGKWVTIYRKNQGEGYLDFEKWLIVDSKVLHDFIMENYGEYRELGLRTGDPWFIFPKRLTVIEVERDSFYHSNETRRKIALARVEFVEDWLAKN